MGRLRDDARAIWSAALAAVAPEPLIAARLTVRGPRGEVFVDGRSLDPPLELDAVGRIVVVGGGKAASGMAAGVESLLGAERLARQVAAGLVSVPAGCGRRLVRTEVRQTRPAGVNLPTPEVVAATDEIIRTVSCLTAADLVVVVLTGGGSALLATPRAGVTLAEKIETTMRLAAAGADIRSLNAARRRLSAVKGGGLALASRAGRMLVLVLSDVVGDDLAVVASAPCLPDRMAAGAAFTTPEGCRVEHVLVGGNSTAVAAAATAARRAGYRVTRAETVPGGPADEVGGRLAEEGLALVAAARGDGAPRAAIEGGESTVVVPREHGSGGRNQQTAVAALARLRGRVWPEELAVASIGTDGEDGPTDAAGGFADAAVAAAARTLDVDAALARRDAHPLLAAADGLIRTGPTGTNVADLRIVLARP